MKFVIANWKMNLSIAQSIALAEEYRKVFKETPAEIVACPSFSSLPFVAKILNDSPVSTGAQDAFWEERGAYTGEISPADVRELGAAYVIIGHSERREYLGEEDWMINRKVKAALATSALCPILCIGETAEDRDEGQREAVLSRQLEEGLDGVELNGNNLIVAYEPVWAIGTGEVPGVDEVEYVHQMIRVLLRRQLGAVSDEACAIVYGGSVSEKTAPELAEIDSVDGFLVGSASLNAREFYRLARTMIE